MHTARLLRYPGWLLALIALLVNGCGAPPENNPAGFSRANSVDTAAPSTVAPTPAPDTAILPPSPISTTATARGKLLIVGPAALLAPAALKAYADMKRDQGWTVVATALPPAPTEQQVLQAIHAAFDRELAQATDDRPAGHVLLVGDAPAGKPGTTAAGRLPCNTRNSSFLGAIASDFAYSLPDGRQPRLAVGRLPVRSAEAFTAYLERQSNVEQEPPAAQTALRNRLHFIAGAPGYSPELDKLIENFAFAILTEKVPQELDLRVLYTSPSSEYSTGQLTTDRAEAEDLIEQGAFATVVCSHGTITAISGRARERLLENEHIAALAGKASRTHLFIFTCSSGNFANAPSRSPINGRLINNPDDPDEQSLAEVAVLNPRGPLMTVAASSFSHPIFNKYYCDILIAEMLQRNPADWGEAWYRVQRRFASHRDVELEALLKDVEKIGDLDTAAVDHTWMYNYLGDPTLRFQPLALKLPLFADRRADAGGDSGVVRVYGRSTEIRHGSVEIDVIVARDGIAKKRPKFQAEDSPAEHRTTAVKRYRLTTDKTIAQATVQLNDGEFSQVFHLAGSDWLRAKQVRILIRGRDGTAAAGIAEIVAAGEKQP